MKKSIFSILALCTACAAAAGLSGCKSCDDDGPDAYGKIQEILNKNYSQIVLTVTDTFAEGVSLQSVYTVNYGESDVTIEYSIEKFTSLSLDAASPQFKTVKTGSVVLKDGVIVKQEGDSADFSYELISAGGLNFKEEYFTAVTINNVSFKADITNPSGFFGTAVDCTGAKIQSVFADYMAEIVVSYTSSSGSSVEYEYRFTPKF